MKQLFLFFITLFSFFSFFHGVSASENIDFSVNKTDVSLGDAFQIQINIDSSIFENETISLEIPGIENFEIFAQTQGYSFQDINGTTQSKTTYTIDLRANNSGDFTLGPVKVISPNLTETDDQVLNIQVGENGNISIPIQNQQESETGITNSTTEEETKVSEAEIKGIRRVGIPFFSISLGIISFLILFYFTLQKILKNKKTELIISKKEEISFEQSESFQELMKKYFKQLESKKETIDTQLFFQKYNTGIRNILLQQKLSNALTGTLEELKKENHGEKNSFLSLLEQSYIGEYSQKEIDTEQKTKFIDDVITLLDRI